MPRASMADLISRTRALIGDPAGPEQTFSDDEVEAALDRYQTVVRFAYLRAEPTPLPGGVVEYRDYYADRGDWEADATLIDGGFYYLTPTSADYRTGHWTFASPGQQPPVKIIGKVYDIYGAAADLLITWSAKLKLEYDFSADGQSYSRSQQADALLALAAEYRRAQRPATVVQVRPDTGEGW